MFVKFESGPFNLVSIITSGNFLLGNEVRFIFRIV